MDVGERLEGAVDLLPGQYDGEVLGPFGTSEITDHASRSFLLIQEH